MNVLIAAEKGSVNSDIQFPQNLQYCFDENQIWPKEELITNTRDFTSTITSTTKFFSVRGRGRQANLKISADALGDDWRFGTVRMDIKPDGRR